MARPFKNETGDFFGSDGIIRDKLITIELPKFNKITYQVKMGVDDDGKQHYATTDYVSNLPTPKDMDVIESKPHTMKLRDTCPNCLKQGRPRMARRPNHIDYHVRSHNSQKSFKTGRQDSYFLVYDHKIDGKTVTHSIVRFDENHGFFTKRGKLSSKLQDVMFPYFVKSTKNI